MLIYQYSRVLIARAIGPLTSIIMLYLANSTLGLDIASKLIELIAYSAVTATFSLFGIQQILIRESAGTSHNYLVKIIMKNLSFSIIIYLVIMIFLVSQYKDFMLFNSSASDIVIIFGVLNMVSIILSSLLIGNGAASMGLILSLSFQNIFFIFYLLTKTFATIIVMVILWLIFLTIFIENIENCILE